MPTYTEEEVQALLKAQEDRLEAVHFEEQTKKVLDEINKRLNEANGYKATIGKNVIEVINEVKSVKARIESLEQARVDQLEAKSKEEVKKHMWFQDWWIRTGITLSIVYEAIQTAHSLGWI